VFAGESEWLHRKCRQQQEEVESCTLLYAGNPDVPEEKKTIIETIITKENKARSAAGMPG